MRAVFLVLHECQELMVDNMVALMSNNIAIVAYIDKHFCPFAEVGTSMVGISFITWLIFGSRNIIADQQPAGSGGRDREVPSPTCL